jgi:hypothetical protein
MAILVFVLGAMLIAGGLASLAAAINLVPTEMGLLYAVSGVIFLSAGGVVLAIAALIAHIGRFRPRADKGGGPPAPAAGPREPAAEEDDVNLNRSGHLPSLRAVEEAIAHPQGPPQVVGRYTAGGAKYMIYSDGAIEAETEDGAFRFASMGEFKSYIDSRKT